MATSLAQQLKKLAIPQTNVLIDSKKRASLLFDPSEAAKLTRDDFFEIGKDGLRELIEINTYFQDFKDTLFNSEKINFQRVVESKEVNKKLDKEIKNFLIKLSPYFLLRSSHKALEWLIFRFKIHEINVRELFALMLPYHETNIFVKLLQAIDLNTLVFKDWLWLKPFKKEGLHVPRSVIINHAISDSSFLRFVCDSTVQALKVHKKTGTEFKLQTLLAFYTSTVVGLLARGSTNDHLLTVLLPSLIIGLESSVADFKAAACMSLAQLVVSNQLSVPLASQVLEIIIKDQDVHLRKSRVYTVLAFYQRQSPKPPFPRQLLLSWDWSVDILSELAQSGVFVGPLLSEMIEACLDLVVEDGSQRVNAQVLCWSLAEVVQCDGVSAASIFRLMVSYHDKLSFLPKKRKHGDDDGNNLDSNSANWLKTLIETTCAKYADAFDKLQGDIELKQLRRKWSPLEGDEGLDVAISSLVRQCLAGNHSIWPQLKVALLKQIEDNKVFKILCKTSPPSEPLTLLLCLERILRTYDNQATSKLILKKISESSYGSRTPYFPQLVNALKDEPDGSIVAAVEAFFMKTWPQIENRPDVTAFNTALRELKASGKIGSTSMVWPLALKMLASIIPSEASETVTNNIINILGLIKTIKAKHQLSVLSTYLDKFKAENLTFPDWIDLSQTNLAIYLRVKILELSLEGLHKNNRCRNDFEAFVNNYFQTIPNGRSVVRFLSAVCAGVPAPLNSKAIFSPLLQVYALHWSWSQLSKGLDVVYNSFKPELIQLSSHLLLSMASDSLAVRKCALKVVEAIVIMINAHSDNSLPFSSLLTELLKKSSEIIADKDQLNVVLYCLLSPDEYVRNSIHTRLAKSLTEDREKLLEVLTSPHVPLYIVAQLSILLETVNSVEIMKKLVPLGKRALNCGPEVYFCNIIMSSYWQRLSEFTTDALDDPEIWNLAKSSLVHYKGDSRCPAVAFLQSVTKDIYAALSRKQQLAVMDLMVAARVDTRSPTIASAVASSCRKIAMDGEIVVELLMKMINGFPKELNLPSTTILEKETWKHGISLLELIQNKRKLRNARLLIAPFFTVLKFCLDQEEQTAFEYAKQLVLGCLLDFSERLLEDNSAIEPALLNVELIVQCLRASSNPQTHHHALLLLSCLGSVIPNQVMHNMMAIFTFMGTSLTRLDDEHSVQVVTKVVDTIIPVLIKNLNVDSLERDVVVAEVLRIFVWTLRDIPQHRRKPLFDRLLITLDPDRSLWTFLVLLFENYVVSYQQVADKNADGSMPPNLQLGMELVLSFGPLAVLNTAIQLIRYLIQIPIHRMNPRCEDEEMDEDLEANGLFDVRKHTPKQLRHYTYTLITFLNSLLADSNLIVQVRELEGSNIETVECIFKEAVAALLLYTAVLSSTTQQQDVNQSKFWKAMVTHGYDVLDRLVALVSSDTLVSVINGLLNHTADNVRRKVVDLLNVHIQNHRGAFTNEEKESLSNLITPLLNLACSDLSGPAQGDLIQQTALLSLRLLAKILAPDDPQPFKEVLVEVTKLCQRKGHLLASAALTVADLVAHLRARAVSELPRFLPAMLKAFSKFIKAESTDIVLMSLAAALYRIVEVLAQFLSPYMDKILKAVSCLSVKWPDAADLNRKLLQIRQKIAASVPHRVLIPATNRCYDKLIEDKLFSAVGPLFSILADSFNAAPDVNKILPSLTPFFISVLQLRSDSADGHNDVSDKDIEMIEGFAMDSLLSLVLKLSESTFKPLSYQLHHWASGHTHRSITFYRLSSRLAEGLKGLFVLFVGHFLQNTADLLDKTNVTKNTKPYFGDSKNSEANTILLLESILKTLHTVFLFDSSTFLSKDKFQVLLRPLVDQLDNTLGGPEVLEERSKRLLTPCIAQMTLAMDDTQWKELNYQLLTKTQSQSPLVRIAALNTVVEVAAKLGEDYLPLIPEAANSLNELLEDEDERVELAMKSALRRMEDVLGQSIRDLFP